MNYEEEAKIHAIINVALAAAGEATDKHIAENPGVWFPCGFASVNIKPARGPFVTWLKKHGVGHTDEYLGGYTIYNPSGNPTQWMDAKEKGARAFAAELKKFGLNCTVHARMD